MQDGGLDGGRSSSAVVLCKRHNVLCCSFTIRQAQAMSAGTVRSKPAFEVGDAKRSMDVWSEVSAVGDQVEGCSGGFHWVA